MARKPGPTATLWEVNARDTEASRESGWGRALKQGAPVEKIGTLVDAAYGLRMVEPSNKLKKVVKVLAEYHGPTSIIVATIPFNGGQTPIFAAQGDYSVRLLGWCGRKA